MYITFLALDTQLCVKLKFLHDFFVAKQILFKKKTKYHFEYSKQKDDTSSNY